MQRRKFLVGLGSLAAGGAAAMGTGAFAVQARDRDGKGTTVRDDDAYLRLIPNSENGYQLSGIASDGELDVTLNALNSDSVTRIDNIFFIRNEGTGPVDVRITNVGGFGGDVSINAVFVSSGDAGNGNDLLNNFGANLGVGDQIGVGAEIEVSDKGTGSVSGTFDVDADEA